MPIRLVLADDHPILLAGLQQLLSLEADFAIVATCTSGEAALEAVQRLRPEVLIVDLQMPGKDGLAVLRELRADQSRTRTVILTADLDEDDVLEAMRLGVCGVVLKDMAPSLLVQCIRQVNAGGQWLERDLMAKAVDKLLRRQAAAKEAADLLTARELEIVRLVAQGQRNKEIAHKLAITEGTVKVHLHNIYDKVRVDSRVGLTLYAQTNGLI
jgi:DNA-binding NarL/FixJ family response regulator